MSDRGVIVINNGVTKFHVTQVTNLKGLTFHCGKFETTPHTASIKLSSDSSLARPTVSCQIDALRRYQISLNHTGVHIVNHALRWHFGAEHSIIQMNSVVGEDHFKFEFKFNEMMHKPTVEDLTSAQAICNDLIRRAVPVYANQSTRIDDLDDTEMRAKFKYPVRKLNDVLYPVNIRVVSLGASWDKFQK